MKNLVFKISICLVTLSSCHHSQNQVQADENIEYFVRPCKFISGYTYNDTTKWIMACRVWGLLKYYHPNVTSGKLDWDEVLLNRMEDIRRDSTPEMVNADLKKLIAAAGEYTYKKDDGWNDSLRMNVNLGWIDNSFLDEGLKKELKKIASIKVESPSYYGVDFESTLMPHEKQYDDIDVATSSSSSLRYRLLSLFRYWNVIYYFFPHKYLMDESWDQTLAKSIFPFAEANDSRSYQIAFLKLAASLHDGHGFLVMNNQQQPDYRGLVEIVKRQTVVKVNEGKFRRGDIVESVGERDIDRVRDSLSLLISASTQGNKDSQINRYVAEMIFSQERDVAVSRNGRQIKVNTTPVFFDKKQSDPFKWIANNIGYVDFTTLSKDRIDSVFRCFSEAKGIIFDLRKGIDKGYDATAFASHLFEYQNDYLLPPTMYPDLGHPGAFAWKKRISTPIPNRPGVSRFKGKIVFLIDENTQSATESVAWEGQTNLHATLIGRSTSGALGRATWIYLPGNCKACFSNFGLFSLDGVELQRRGIFPNIEVYPTIESIKAGKDEILDKAIEYLK
jgi:carboxyl-terminal processing protease